MGGPVPLPWQELDAYNRITGNVYSAWSLTVIRSMSEAYSSWYAKGGEQEDIADEVPYILRNEETMAAAGKMIMKSRDESAKLRENLNG